MTAPDTSLTGASAQEQESTTEKYINGTPTECPSCKANLIGEDIPENIREHYSPPYKWMRTIALYDQRRDRTTAWKCPDCGHEWWRV